MNKEMDTYSERGVELHLDREMSNFANIIEGTMLDYFYINSAEWDIEQQELFIVLKVLPKESEDLTDVGRVKYIKFMSKYNSEYFTAQVMKDANKLEELEKRFEAEHEVEIQQSVFQYLIKKYQEVKTISHTSGSTLSLDIELEPNKLFQVGKI